jgi:hypothetical protein
MTNNGSIFFLQTDSRLAESNSSTDSALLALANHARVHDHNAVSTRVSAVFKSQH